MLPFWVYLGLQLVPLEHMHSRARWKSTIDSMGTWNTAVLYHLIHMLSLHSLYESSDLSSKYRLAGNLMLSGVSLFSGSLYGLELGPKSVLGTTTPIGGVLMTAGWAVLGLKREDPFRGLDM